jgi:hypothetical protein
MKKRKLRDLRIDTGVDCEKLENVLLVIKLFLHLSK